MKKEINTTINNESYAVTFEGNGYWGFADCNDDDLRAEDGIITVKSTDGKVNYTKSQGWWMTNTGHQLKLDRQQALYWTKVARDEKGV